MVEGFTLNGVEDNNTFDVLVTFDAFDQQILDEVPNPEHAEFNLETGKAWLFAYYQTNNFEADDFNVPNLPATWQQLSTNLEGRTMWETQFLGDIDDRILAEIAITRYLQSLQNQSLIREFRIRYNYPPIQNISESEDEEEEDDEEDEENYEDIMNRYSADRPIPAWFPEILRR